MAEWRPWHLFCLFLFAFCGTHPIWHLSGIPSGRIAWRLEEPTVRWLNIVTSAPALILLAACGLFGDIDARIERDRERFGSIAADRPIGSACGQEDSASLKRRRVHPRWPTGGWGGRALLDPQRVRRADTNEWLAIGGEYTGYVKFAQPGRLQARSYDDVYGEVYCGWAPQSVQYTPRQEHVHVAFSRCSVGDGGIDQVHEICWFPEGGDEGTILYSTAHPEESTLEFHEVYELRHFSRLSNHGDTNSYYFNEYVADQVIRSLLLARKIDEAHAILTEALANLRFLPEVVDGGTLEPVPMIQFYAELWLNLLLLEAGLEAPGDGSLAALDRAGEVLADADRHCYDCRYAVGMIDLYRWAILGLRGERVPLPEIPETASRVIGNNPHFIVELLRDPSKNEHTLSRGMLETGGETTYFWMGIRASLAGNRDDARRYFEHYIQAPDQGLSEFELSATATLLARMSASPNSAS